MLRLTLSTLALAAGLLTTGAPAMAQAIDTAAIETATGLKGSYNRAENVFKVSKPRDDVKINVDRWTMPPSRRYNDRPWARPSCRKGMPNASRSAYASSLFLAVVVIVMSRPRTRSIAS